MSPAPSPSTPMYVRPGRPHSFSYPHLHHQNPLIPLYVALAILALILIGFGISEWIRWASPQPAEPEAPLPAEEGIEAPAPNVLVQIVG